MGEHFADSLCMLRNQCACDGQSVAHHHTRHLGDGADVPALGNESDGVVCVSQSSLRIYQEQSMFIILLTQSFAYTPVNGISFPNQTQIEEYDFYHGIKLKIKLYRQKNTEYYDNLIYRGIYSSSLSAWKRIEKLGMIDRECNPSDLLEIFEISETQLNNPKRFPLEYIGNPAAGVPNLWGYFDPRASEPGFDAIVVSNHGSNSINFRLIVHEIAHYWYSSFCLAYHTEMTSEQFAISIEKEVTWHE